VADGANPKWLRDWMELDSESGSPSGQVAAPFQDAAEEKYRSGENKGESGKDDPHRPSADFTALIHAIKREGAAYRKEEQREDRGKKIREWVTIVLIACTFGAVCWQVREMVKVYDPIQRQAEAAQKSAEAAVIAAEAAKTQTDAISRQAQTTAEANIESQRAWVGPENASFSIEPTIGKPIDIVIQYQNTGRSPAFVFRYFADPFPSTVAQQNDGTTDKLLNQYLTECKNLNEWQGGSVIYPITGGLGGGGYSLTLKTKEDFADEAMTKGDTMAVIRGCFVYQSFKLPRHSYFCFFYKQGQTKIQNLNICPTWHYAD
jgi:hypothetical protein